MGQPIFYLPPAGHSEQEPQNPPHSSPLTHTTPPPEANRRKKNSVALHTPSHERPACRRRPATGHRPLSTVPPNLLCAVSLRAGELSSAPPGGDLSSRPLPTGDHSSAGDLSSTSSPGSSPFPPPTSAPPGSSAPTPLPLCVPVLCTAATGRSPPCLALHSRSKEGSRHLHLHLYGISICTCICCCSIR
jgi:hypothetical protein